ncbi:MAG: periplasmic heavy metal sensor [Alphaproteobacteria bacterium]|nr:periplasmic heavy metal sensor [Alphaproteobacteria bacterium]
MSAPVSKTKRWLLIGSLALNLFLIGFMAIGFARHHKDHDRPPRPFIEMMRFMQGSNDDRPGNHFLDHMPDQDRDVLLSLKAKHGPALAQAEGEARATRMQLRRLMQDGIRDPEILSAALLKARNAQEQFFDETNALLLDIAQSLSDDGYKMLAEKRLPRPD